MTIVLIWTSPMFRFLDMNYHVYIGIKPVNLMADPKYVRAWPGGKYNYNFKCI